MIQFYHNIDYDEEMEDFLNEEGRIDLLSGEIISEDALKRNGFDYIQITGINTNGDTEILIRRIGISVNAFFRIRSKFIQPKIALQSVICH